MKLKLITTLILLLSLTSCEPKYEDTFYLKNLSGQSVTCKLEFDLMMHDITYTNNVTINESEEKQFYSIDVTSTGGSCFDKGDMFILNDSNFKITFIFEDGTTIRYDNNSTFSKNPCITCHWEIINIIDKRLNKQYHAIYTITKEDYQNATNQK
ncbi:MAG: hypothetical protein IJZ87_02495 [Bacteroidales bacterium]|nr:hypothetical protein [Bacteroidales bacterium]